MKRTIELRKDCYRGDIAASNRRAHVMCNAYYGLDLFAGLRRTPTEVKATATTIRFLRRKGLLYENEVTHLGYVFLRQLKQEGKP